MIGLLIASVFGIAFVVLVVFLLARIGTELVSFLWTMAPYVVGVTAIFLTLLAVGYS